MHSSVIWRIGKDDATGARATTPATGLLPDHMSMSPLRVA
jgi:hypothetical protein